MKHAKRRERLTFLPKLQSEAELARLVACVYDALIESGFKEHAGAFLELVEKEKSERGWEQVAIVDILRQTTMGTNFDPTAVSMAA